jgi:hypothetical protein
MKGEQMSNSIKGDLTERCGSVPQAPLQSLGRREALERIEAALHHLERPECGWSLNSLLDAVDHARVVLSGSWKS